MLRPSQSTASLVSCSTCRFAKDSRTDEAGRSGGALFTSALETALADHWCRDRLCLQTMPCLFACGSHCTVYVRSEHRVGYILGRFSPARQDAIALLDYVAQYLQTPDGVVPYSRWPDGVKGHFLVRVPPDGFVWDPTPNAVSPAVALTSPG